jgi:hypothetical protein
MDDAGCCRAWVGLLPKLEGGSDEWAPLVSEARRRAAYCFG